MAAFQCRICSAVCALRGSGAPFQAATMQEIWEHIESSHHVARPRLGETYQQAGMRFLDAHPDAFPRGRCNCPTCATCREKTAHRVAANN